MENKRSLALIFFITLSLTIQAQEVFRPWEGIREKSRVRLWYYAPRAAHSTGTGIIILPGGSYHHLGINNEGHRVAEALAQKGYSAFVLRYSTSMYGYNYPTMMEDIQRAVMLVKENASEFGINPDQVGLMGFSAGGHLAGWMGTYYDTNFLAHYGLEPSVSLRPAFVAMIYPVVSMADGITHVKSRRNLLAANHPVSLRKKLSLEENVRDDMPPVFLMTCMDDPVVDPENTLRYSAVLEKRQIDHRLLIYKEGGHGFGYDEEGNNETALLWMQEFLLWLDKEIIQ
ncbi:MAG: alpha/beta hydrolase [Bacteroidales bacterium]|jgi:acetyl esterase/lipase